MRVLNELVGKEYYSCALTVKNLAIALEQAIYEGVELGRIVSADDLDTLTKHVFRDFDLWIDRHDELKMRWITNRLFYEDPLYNINYVYGSLLALKYYHLYLQAL